MARLFFIVMGSIFLAAGILGIALPVLPTTPFLLLSAACCFRSSDRLYSWLINHRTFGRYISDIREKKAMPLQAKLAAVFMMWAMICLSAALTASSPGLRSVLIILGGIGTIAVLSVPTLK